MMAGITLLCIWLGVNSHRANRQRRAVEVIAKVGGEVYYDYQTDQQYEVLEEAFSPPPGPNWLRNLIGIDYLANVVRVDLICDKVGNRKAIAASADLSNLRSLRIVGDGVDDVGMAQIGKLTTLRTLCLGGALTSITDAGWEPLEKLTELTDLQLDGATDAAMSHAKHLTGLTNLTLSGDANITNSGLNDIATLTELRGLTLNGDQITDSGLGRLKALRKLRVLEVWSRNTTEEGRANLENALPNLIRCPVVDKSSAPENASESTSSPATIR
jgi:hypothetical protein